MQQITLLFNFFIFYNMAKIFKTSEDIAELAQDVFEETGLPQIGITMKVMSVPKQKQVIKVSKANATVEFIGKVNDCIILYIYEEAFDRMDDEGKKMLLESALCNVSFDTEKDKLNIESNPYKQVFSMRRKYGERFINIFETSNIIIDEIEEEKKQKKLEEREAKKNKK